MDYSLVVPIVNATHSAPADRAAGVVNRETERE